MSPNLSSYGIYFAEDGRSRPFGLLSAGNYNWLSVMLVATDCSVIGWLPKGEGN